MGVADIRIQDWEWYLYHPDGVITRYDPFEEEHQFRQVEPNDAALYPQFVKKILCRIN
ncbi:hypothetical protein DNHGIG_32420 [Collibacillus ludicampi]|uniref:Uncharacterized protein n=1 Tax=Collibacillus ludicampi TaxID=2771369 RepID=A0AAV4LIU2_9BACL|nr:hypothetical protein DNHGIG_32420 [Collibacillus ludicampi]